MLQGPYIYKDTPSTWSSYFCIICNTTCVPGQDNVVRFINKHFIHDDTLDMFIYEYTKLTLATMSSWDEMMDNFNSVVSQMHNIAPIRSKETTWKPKTPWRIGERVRMLKRSCRRAERKWRKTELQLDYEHYKNPLNCSNKDMKFSRQHHVSQMINDNKNKANFFFSTMDELKNYTRSISAEFLSSSNCSEFATYF